MFEKRGMKKAARASQKKKIRQKGRGKGKGGLTRGSSAITKWGKGSVSGKNAGSRWIRGEAEKGPSFEREKRIDRGAANKY